MTPLFPELAGQLGDRAEALARPRSFWRDHLRGFVVLVLALSSVGGAAYASRGLWQPQLGDDRRGHATASASPVPDEQLEVLAVLRRPQVAADRGFSSQYALNFQDAEAKGVRTNSVRLLTEGTHGRSAVLIPVERRDNPDGSGKRDALCLWVRDTEDGGGLSCTTTDEFLRSGMGMSTMSPEALAVSEGRSHDPHAKAYVVGLVPDGVDHVRYGTVARFVDVPVRENAYAADIPAELERTSIAWLDRSGKEVRYPTIDSVGEALALTSKFAARRAKATAPGATPERKRHRSVPPTSRRAAGASSPPGRRAPGG